MLREPRFPRFVTVTGNQHLARNMSFRQFPTTLYMPPLSFRTFTNAAKWLSYARLPPEMWAPRLTQCVARFLLCMVGLSYTTYRPGFCSSGRRVLCTFTHSAYINNINIHSYGYLATLKDHIRGCSKILPHDLRLKCVVYKERVQDKINRRDRFRRWHIGQLPVPLSVTRILNE